MKTKTFAALALVGVMTFAVNVVPAQAASTVCTNLFNNMTVGSRDISTNGEVTKLQAVLYAQGYLGVSPTGYFGSLTRAATQSFQSANGIITTGYVGPLTRARIQVVTCGEVPPSPTVSIYSLSPVSGLVGTVVTVYGRGFTSNSIVHFSVGAIGTPTFIDSGTLRFVVPSSIGPYCRPGTPCPMYMARITTPGTYGVSVENTLTGAVSNIINFFVSDTANSKVFSINGLDAPSSIPVSNTGTWTVRVNNPVSAYLHYSVNWGDEGLTPSTSLNIAPQETTVQSSASFSHIYRSTGTFTPFFTVSDDSGNSANTSASVVVTPIY